MIKFETEEEKQVVIDCLEENMNEEYRATLQYVCHRISAQGKNSMLAEAFKTAALDEMAHILYFSDMITKLGGDPVFTDWEIDKSTDLKIMLQKDIHLEKEAIKRYSDQLEKLRGYPELHSIIEGVLSDEEDHRDTFADFMKRIIPED
jgi:bacterioferritin (cytochrome b1)